MYLRRLPEYHSHSSTKRVESGISDNFPLRIVLMNSPSVTTLTGVGAKSAQRLAQLNILSVQDLLLHLPARYENRTRVHSLSEVKHGDHVFIEGRVIEVKTMGARRYLRCTLQDHTQRKIDLMFFYLTKVHEKNLLNAKGP